MLVTCVCVGSWGTSSSAVARPVLVLTSALQVVARIASKPFAIVAAGASTVLPLVTDGVIACAARKPAPITSACARTHLICLRAFGILAWKALLVACGSTAAADKILLGAALHGRAIQTGQHIGGA